MSGRMPKRDYMVRAPAAVQEDVGSSPTAAEADVAQQEGRFTNCRPRLGGRGSSVLPQKNYVVRSSTGRAPHCE